MIRYDWNLESKFHFHLRDFTPFYLTCRHHFQNLLHAITGFVEAFLTLTLKPHALGFSLDWHKLRLTKTAMFAT